MAKRKMGIMPKTKGSVNEILKKRINTLKKENAKLKQQLEEQYKNKREFRIVTYECDWVLTDFWLPVAVVFSMSAFIITIYFLCLRQ